MIMLHVNMRAFRLALLHLIEIFSYGNIYFKLSIVVLMIK